MATATHDAGLTRREVVQRMTTLMGGTALVGGDRLLSLVFDRSALDVAVLQDRGAFSATDIALLDEIAETILPETSTPGAKAAKTGAFMARMVTEAYTERDRQVFREGMSQLDSACRARHGAGFMQASASQRLTLLQVLDREQKTATEERANAPRSRAPAAERPEDRPAHYFRMMRELALLGYFTSEIGYTKAMRYIETPGRFDPCATHAPGDKSWASHA